MNSETGQIFSVVMAVMAVIVAGVALIVFAEIGQRVAIALIDHLKEDWTYRLSFRLQNNRYRGLSRLCYPLWVILYYFVKAVFIIELCVFFYMMSGLGFIVRWIWRIIKYSKNTRTRFHQIGEGV